MKVYEIITEARVPSVRDQIVNDVQRHGGELDDYFVRFTMTDKLGFSNRQWFGRSPDVDHPKFDIDYIGSGIGRRALWFYPLKVYLDQARTLYAAEQPHVWLVKLKPDAWLQPVGSGDKKVKEPPQGKQRVGILKMNRVPAAIFFTYGFDVVGQYYDYASRHRRHGQVKGPLPPSWFDRIRGYQ